MKLYRSLVALSKEIFGYGKEVCREFAKARRLVDRMEAGRKEASGEVLKP